MTTGEKTSQMAAYSTLTPAVLTDLLCIDRPNDDSYKSPLADFRTLLFGANADWAADPLVIDGAATLNSTLRLGNDQAALTGSQCLSVQHTSTNTNASGVKVRALRNPALAGGFSHGGWFEAEIDPTNAIACASLDGMFAEAFHYGSGLLTVASGLVAVAQALGAGAITTLVGSSSEIGSGTTGSGIITNAKAFWAKPVVNTGTGSIVNAYGLYVDAVTVGTTLNYAIKTLGGRIGFVGLPTSAAGLATGDLWNNAGVLNVA